MKSIGVRELRQNASIYLRLVEAGETVQVTDHGRPVALLSPVPKPVPEDESTYERMVREGRVTPAVDPTFDILDITPHPPKPGVPLPSVLLERDRQGDESTFERLIREGGITLPKDPTRHISDIEPSQAAPGVPLPSVLLERDRYGDDA